MLETITNISRYSSAYAILEEFCGSEFWDNIDEEDDRFLRNFDSFEGLTIYCINDEIFTTDFWGQVVGYSRDIGAFLLDIEELLNQDRAER